MVESKPTSILDVVQWLGFTTMMKTAYLLGLKEHERKE
jgi:hypothetical protein